MDYLKKLFEESLDSRTPEVMIAGFAFKPSQVLKSNEEAYQFVLRNFAREIGVRLEPTLGEVMEDVEKLTKDFFATLDTMLEK